MHLQTFLGHVQHRARLASMEEALRATRATLGTLGERLAGGEPGNLAAQIPEELRHILASGDAVPEAFSSDTFLERVSQREAVDLPTAVFHSRAVLSVLTDTVDAGTLDHVQDQLPGDYRRLFEPASEGRMSG